MSDSNISRRSVAKGTAWSIPTLVAVAAAPMAAASAAPVYAITGTVKYNQAWTTTNLTGNDDIRIYSGRPTPGAGAYCVSNTTTKTRITDVSTTFWFASSQLTFARSASYDTNCWSVLTRDPAQASHSHNGHTYYAYSSRLTCAVTATQGTTCLPAFAWYSQNVGTGTTIVKDLCGSTACATKLEYYTSSTATINGAAQPLVYGPVSLRA